MKLTSLCIKTELFHAELVKSGGKVPLTAVEMTEITIERLNPSKTGIPISTSRKVQSKLCF